MVKYSQLQENDIQEITSNYELAVINFESLEGGSGNSNYLLHTEQGKFVLTVFEIIIAVPGRKRFSHDTLAHSG